MNKFEKFNRFEKIFFRVNVTIFGFGLVLLSMVFLAQNAIESIARIFLDVATSLLFIVIINFLISVVRLFKYLIGFRNDQDKVTIRRTIAVMLSSPVAFGIYLIVTIVMSASLVSCS